MRKEAKEKREEVVKNQQRIVAILHENINQHQNDDEININENFFPILE
jgi:hypothetical protein